MKKILIICSMFFAFNVSALTPSLNYQENIYSNRLDNNNKIHSGLMAFMYMNDEIVYCLDPYMIVGNDYSIDINYHINNDDLEYFKLVAYYGYNKTNRNSIYYYMAAQELIWERILGGDKVFWTTEKYNEGEKINIDTYKNEIINNINNFNTLPSFSYSTYELLLNEENYIYDENNIIDSYTIKNNSNAVTSKNGNNLIIKPISTHVSPIYLSRSIKLNSNTTTIYTTSGGQTLISFGGDVTKISKLNINVIFNKNVYIRFFDSETNKIKHVDFSVCQLEKDWYKYDQEYYTYPDKIKDGIYNLCGLDEYEPQSFDINSTNEEDVYFDIYLERKDKTNIDGYYDEEENDLRRNTINENNDAILEDENYIEEIPNYIDDITDKKEKNTIIKTLKEDKSVNDLKETVKEKLPNTYNYEIFIYLFFLSIIWVNIFHEIKHKN